MFEILKGAKVWVFGDACPILQLSDGSVVWARQPERSVSPEAFARAEPAIKGDFEFWENSTPDRAVEPKV